MINMLLSSLLTHKRTKKIYLWQKEYNDNKKQNRSVINVVIHYSQNFLTECVKNQTRFLIENLYVLSFERTNINWPLTSHALHSYSVSLFCCRYIFFLFCFGSVVCDKENVTKTKPHTKKNEILHSMKWILAERKRASKFRAARDDFKKIPSARADREWNYKYDSAQTKSLIDSVSPFPAKSVYKKQR